MRAEVGEPRPRVHVNDGLSVNGKAPAFFNQLQVFREGSLLALRVRQLHVHLHQRALEGDGKKFGFGRGASVPRTCWPWSLWRFYQCRLASGFRRRRQGKHTSPAARPGSSRGSAGVRVVSGDEFLWVPSVWMAERTNTTPGAQAGHRPDPGWTPAGPLVVCILPARRIAPIGSASIVCGMTRSSFCGRRRHSICTGI